MKAIRTSIWIMVLTVVAAPGSLSAQTPMGTAFTYQGQLKDGGVPVTDTCNFEFECYDAAAGGSPLGGTVTTNGVPVVNGLFTVTVDFDTSSFTGEARWLEVSVQCSGDGSFTTLSPRHALTPTPYALYAAAGGAGDGHSLNAADGVPTDVVYVDDNGWVGIGTTTPGRFVEMEGDIDSGLALGIENTNHGSSAHALVGMVAGDGNASVFVGSENYVQYDGVGKGLHLFQIDPNPISLLTDREVRMLVSGDGKVGIGTTSPGAYLDVTPSAGTAGGQILRAFSPALTDYASHGVAVIQGGPASGYTGTVLQVQSRASDDAGYALLDVRNAVATVPSSKLYVRGDGNIGIGTTTPDEDLHVVGTAQMDSFKMPTAAANGHVLTSDASGVGTWQPASGGIGGSGTAGYIPKFASSTSIGDSVVYESGAGRIGIGNTDPGAKLDVSGSVQATGAIVAPSFYDRDNTSFFVNPEDPGQAAVLNGAVSIGTETPLDVDLHINAGSDVGQIAVGGTREANGEDVGLMTFVGHNSDYLPSGIVAFAGIGGRIITNTTYDYTGALLLYTANIGAPKFTEKMRISPNGNVGIGTESPGEKLTVAGMIESTQDGFKFPDGSIQTTAAGGGVAGWNLTGNSGTDVTVNFLGTLDDEPLELRVNDERVFRFEPDPISPNLIGGYYGNSTTNGVYGVTIGGGGEQDHPNRVTGNYGTVGGGRGNTAGWGGTVGGGQFNATGTYATVGGGWGNSADENSTVAGGYDNVASNGYATVGGGASNSAMGAAATISGGSENVASNGYATVAGGHENLVEGYGATVGGGESNEAGGEDATVPGGYWNRAEGDFSFAAGYRAKANTEGTFVWADHNLHDFPTSTESGFTPAVNQFLVRATGGAVFVTGTDIGTGDSTAGVYVSAGGTSWNSLSDRALKEKFTPVDRQAILAKLAALPVQEYKLKSQDASIRHIGPVAQDFATFGYGESDRAINMEDAHGVALAAIQGLHEIVKEKDAEIADLRARIEAIEALLSDSANTAKGGAR